MPFGLVNAPSTAARFGQTIFQEYLDDFLEIFLDDLLIYSKTLEEHKRHIELVLQKLLKYKLFVKAGKCEFLLPKVNYLGFGITADGMFIEDWRKKAIADWPIPQEGNVLKSRMKSGRQSRCRDGKTWIRSFLGVCGFFRKWIRGYAKLAKPLTDLLKEENSFSWLP